MNDERSLVKQLKWMKQELNNLKIAHERVLGSISFYKDTTVCPYSGRVTVVAKPLDRYDENFFAIIGTSDENASSLENLDSSGALFGTLTVGADGGTTHWRGSVNLASGADSVGITVYDTSPIRVDVKKGWET